MIKVGRGATVSVLPAADGLPLLGIGNDVAIPELGPVAWSDAETHTFRALARSSLRRPASSAASADRLAWRGRPMRIVVDHHLHRLLMLDRPAQPLEGL